MRRQQKTLRPGRRGFCDRDGSAEADLGQDALAGEELGAEADDEAHHGQTAVPGFCQAGEAEACVVRHGVNRMRLRQM